MNDLIEFVRARLDEDELTAREANTSPEMVTGIPRSYAEAPVAIHIARFANLDRVLAEVEAKREVVRLAVQARHNASLPEPDFAVGPSGAALFVSGFAAAMEHALRLFAVAYAAHPDYDPKWVPTEENSDG